MNQHRLKFELKVFSEVVEVGFGKMWSTKRSYHAVFVSLKYI